MGEDGQEVASLYGSLSWCRAGTIASGQVAEVRQLQVSATSLLWHTHSPTCSSFLVQEGLPRLSDGLKGCMVLEGQFLDPL